MFAAIGHNLRLLLVTFALAAVAYPALVWGIARGAFPHQAEGSLLRSADGTVVGSSLIAQPFTSPWYFRPRPSAVNFDASAAGGSNLATTNPDLQAKVADRAAAARATADRPAPADLVTTSGSGLDPHLSPEAAGYQIPRVAEARGLTVEQVRAVVERLTERDGEALIGAPPRVNVLLLNRALDEGAATRP